MLLLSHLCSNIPSWETVQPCKIWWNPPCVSKINFRFKAYSVCRKSDGKADRVRQWWHSEFKRTVSGFNGLDFIICSCHVFNILAHMHQMNQMKCTWAKTSIYCMKNPNHLVPLSNVWSIICLLNLYINVPLCLNVFLDAPQTMNWTNKWMFYTWEHKVKKPNKVKGLRWRVFFFLLFLTSSEMVHKACDEKKHDITYWKRKHKLRCTHDSAKLPEFIISQFSLSL